VPTLEVGLAGARAPLDPAITSSRMVGRWGGEPGAWRVDGLLLQGTGRANAELPVPVMVITRLAASVAAQGEGVEGRQWSNGENNSAEAQPQRMPTDRARPEVASFKDAGARRDPGELSGALQELAREAGHPFRPCWRFQCYGAQRGQEDVVVGSPSAGRTHCRRRI